MTTQVENVTTEEIAPERFARFKKALSKIDATYVIVGAAAAVATAVTIVGVLGAKSLLEEERTFSEEPVNEPTPEVVETTQD